MTLSENQKLLIRNAPSSPRALIEFLVDFLDWPLPTGMEPDDVDAIEWDLDDLKLDSAVVAKLSKVMQVPRFVGGQAFGVFILQFEGGRLPVGAVRRLVNQLVKKKRIQAKVGHEQWAMDDLIFFCQADDVAPEMHVVSFAQHEGRQILKAISWGSQDSDARLEHISSQNLKNLKWVNSGPHSGSLQDRELAFTSTYKEGIRTSQVLADLMAEVATNVRSEVEKLYEVETENGPLRELFTEVRRTLNATLTPKGFADMYAQTMVYGLLTARITHPEDFIGGKSIEALKFENPFLDALYAKFRAKGDPTVDVDEFGLRDLWEILAAANIDQILADFGSGQKKNDPVVFFYEEFLSKYDPQQRRELGAYYTPIPVVKFMVSATDSLIKSKFGLLDGIVDTSTWGEFAKAHSLEIPHNVSEDSPVVKMLDPATGTGTFLLEWVRQGLAHIKTLPVAERSRLSNNLLSNFDAFEISLSSYSVAQLKVHLELPKAIRKDFVPNIYLTNALSGLRQDILWDEDPISVQSRLAEQAKFDSNHSIVIGNPPYLRVEGTEAAGWLAEHDASGRSKFDDIHDPAKANTIFSHQANLFNLYVYFWRFAFWKAFERQTGPAMVSFITASSWLRGPGFMGLRKLARKLADDIYVIDLGGDGFSAIADENIFPIKTPVSIVICVRGTNSALSRNASIHFYKVEGSKEQKLDWLSEAKFEEIDFLDGPVGDLEVFAPATGETSWLEYPLLTDLFPWQLPGCKWNRTWPVGTTSSILARRWDRLLHSDDRADRANCYKESKTGRGIDSNVGNLKAISSLPVGSPPTTISRYGYRSFDRQWAFEDPRLSSGFRSSLWESRSERQMFLVSPTTKQIGLGPAAMISLAVPDLDFFHGRGGKDVFPLMRSFTEPNIDPAVARFVSAQIYGDAGLADFGFCEDLFAYASGVMAGTDYSKRYTLELETPGPRIPITTDAELFNAMVLHGKRVIDSQTFGEREWGSRTPPASHSGSNPVPRWILTPTLIPATVKDLKLDSGSSRLYVGDGIVENVSEQIWLFQVSGMPVVKKWLSYRTGSGAGRAKSSDNPLDSIRPTTWAQEWNDELIEVLTAVSQSIELSEEGVVLLDQIVQSNLIPASSMPKIDPRWRVTPSSANESSIESQDTLFE
jgi:hypothetical protein